MNPSSQRSVTTFMGVKQRRGPKAFTLIEMLVVISIIAMLIALLLPALKESRWAAQKVKCQSSIRQVVIGAFNYSVEHRDRLLISAPGLSDESNWYFQIRPYIGEHNLGTISPHGAAAPLLAKGCPYARLSTNIRNSYGLNILMGRDMDEWPRLSSAPNNPHNKLVYFNDCWSARVDRYVGLSSGSELIRTLNGTPTNYDNIPVHDGRGLAFAFMDGHAGYHTRQEVIESKLFFHKW